MENDNRSVNNKEKNIFYEYFPKLKRIGFEETPTMEEIYKVYNNFKEIHNEILKTIDECYKNVLDSGNSTFYKYKEVRSTYLFIEENRIPQYKNAVYGCCFTFNGFFKQFVPTKPIRNIIRQIEKLKSITNNKLSFLIGGVRVLCNISNVIEWIYAVITSCKTNSDNTIIFSIGCQKLKLHKLSFCRFIGTDILKCTKALKPKSICKTIFDDILPLRKYINLRSVTQNIPQLKDFKKYFIIADCAYKDTANYLNKLQQADWYLPINSYRINNYEFNFNNMVYGIVLDNHIDEVAIGFGGTNKSRLLTFLIDASQIANVSPGYVYALGLVEHIKMNTCNKKIVVCGHSLGGGLAQFATAIQKQGVYAYCYNSAGLLDGSYKEVKDFRPFNNIFHYRLEWDYVSCFGKLIGYIYTAKVNGVSCSKSHDRKTIKKSLGL